MFWAPWGDVTSRLTFGVWNLEPSGVRYPRLWEYSTADQPDGTVDVTRVRFDPAVAAADVAVPADLRRSAIANRRRIADVPLGNTQRPTKQLAPGIVKVPARFDILEVRQESGFVIVEGPLSSSYSEKVIADAQKRFGDAQLSAVITTSDAWPHIGGLREYASRGVAIYAPALNLPILQRLFGAKYTTEPDALAKNARAADVHAVSGKTVIGAGANRIELYSIGIRHNGGRPGRHKVRLKPDTTGPRRQEFASASPMRLRMISSVASDASSVASGCSRELGYGAAVGATGGETRIPPT